jgi:hypothetical protein
MVAMGRGKKHPDVTRLECVVVKNVRFSMGGMCHVQNVIFSMAGMGHAKKRQIQHGWNA